VKCGCCEPSLMFVINNSLPPARLQSGVSDCPCSDPLVAQEGGSPIWMETHALNQQLAQNAGDVLDVVFLGDSITERWRETEYGKPVLSALGSSRIFDSFFSKDKGGKYSGVALGISGDTVRRRQPNPLQQLSLFFSQPNFHASHLCFYGDYRMEKSPPVSIHLPFGCLLERTTLVDRGAPQKWSL
jgi:hypothetical protein